LNPCGDFYLTVRLSGIAGTGSVQNFLIPNNMNRFSNCTPEKINQTKERLRQITVDEPYSIKAYVADEALEYGADDPAQMFTDLASSGCQSGIVSSLIYYVDTHRFFDNFYGEIEALRKEYEDSTGEPLQIKGDLKNWLAWFAFEETAFQLARDALELEL